MSTEEIATFPSKGSFILAHMSFVKEAFSKIPLDPEGKPVTS